MSQQVLEMGKGNPKNGNPKRDIPKGEIAKKGNSTGPT